MKKKEIVLTGLILSCLLSVSTNGADTDIQALEIPDIESNLVVKAVSFRKTESIVNGIEVPIFTTDTNVLGRMDTGVLCAVVSPKQFAKAFFVLTRRKDDEREFDLKNVPSYENFKLGRLYLIPYSIKDLGLGQGTNLYFPLGGGLLLNIGLNNYSNVLTTSKLETAGDNYAANPRRYYVSADEARAEVERLRPLVAKYEEQLNEIKTALREERERRKKLGKETMGIYLGDETDKYSMLKKEIYKIGSLHCEAKSEMLNAEKQLQNFNKQSNTVTP